MGVANNAGQPHLAVKHIVSQQRYNGLLMVSVTWGGVSAGVLVHSMLPDCVTWIDSSLLA
jgi:hypothetical protein